MDAHADAPVLYTVGHSTRSLEGLLCLLAAAGVQLLIDVRRAPRSRRHPHFDGAALARSLPAHGIEYAHEAALGGFRRPAPDSPNRGWEHEGFRGYADHMASPEFRLALARLQNVARERIACVMCAEAQWWRCHRRLLSDALLVAGWRVEHLGLGAQGVAHQLTPFALPGEHGTLIYPPPQTELELHA